MNEMDLDFAATARPFASVILCCTGVDQEERLTLVNHAQQMGAVFKADLRSDVTHMVVGNVNTPKYMFAAQNRFDLKIMDLKWIEDAYQKWIQGEDIDFEEIVNAHILLPLFGLHVCLTNVASQDERKFIESQIRSHGAEYHPDLSRQCTHLLCASPTGNKYEAALKWNIPCVGIEWLFQSIERGMALEAKSFSLNIEPDKRGQGAWDRNAALKHSASSRKLDPAYDTAVPTESNNGTRKRRLRRTGSQIAQEGIWEGILGGVTNAQVSAVPHTTQAPSKTVNMSFNIATPIAEESVANGLDVDMQDPVISLFEGMIFYTWGFSDTKREVLADVITKNSGLVFAKPLPESTNETSKSYTVIPFSVPREQAPSGYCGSKVVTEMWIERCIAANTTFNPAEMIMCMPMPGPFPRSWLKNVAISITGFSGPDLLHVERLITLLGASYYRNLTRKRSLLLTPDNYLNGQKMVKAKEWGIPVVNVGWLWKVISENDKDIDIGPWSEGPAPLVRYTQEEASSGLKSSSSNVAICPTAVGNGNSSILHGCVIHVSEKLEILAPELYTIAEHLGAQITRRFDPAQVTHLIHQSSLATEAFREFHFARSANIYIVHPQWLLQCRSHGTRCDEDKWGWMCDAESIVETASANLLSPEARRAKRSRQDENIPPNQAQNPVKLEQLAKLLETISSPQKRTKRKLAGRARTTQTSTTASSIPSPEKPLLKGDEEEAPRPTQEKVEYRDPVAEREMAKIVANLRGIIEDDKTVQNQSSEMTPAEDIGRRGGRRKSTRK